MSDWKMYYTPHAVDDWRRLSDSGQPWLVDRVRFLLGIIENGPYDNPPPLKKLQGDFSGAYSRRINKKHRLVYQIMKEEKAIKILACWGHYDD